MFAFLLFMSLAASDAGRHVAHAGGAFDGLDYSNAVEALEHNHQLGFRLFEVDLNWTSDGQLVLIHDWDTKWRSLFGGAERPDHPTFMAKGMRAGLTQLDLAGLLAWLERHPDAGVVTDIKERNLDALRAVARSAPHLRHRIIPQVYAFAEYAEAKRLGFDRVILTVYRLKDPPEQVAAWAMRERPWAVTIPANRVDAGTFDALLAHDELFVYAHTVNDPAAWERLQEHGVDGIYTDTIAPGSGAAVPAAVREATSPR